MSNDGTSGATMSAESAERCKIKTKMPLDDILLAIGLMTVVLLGVPAIGFALLMVH
jgi:hypothetical protein